MEITKETEKRHRNRNGRRGVCPRDWCELIIDFDKTIVDDEGKVKDDVSKKIEANRNCNWSEK